MLRFLPLVCVFHSVFIPFHLSLSLFLPQFAFTLFMFMCYSLSISVFVCVYLCLCISLSLCLSRSVCLCLCVCLCLSLSLSHSLYVCLSLFIEAQAMIFYPIKGTIPFSISTLLEAKANLFAKVSLTCHSISFLSSCTTVSMPMKKIS